MNKTIHGLMCLLWIGFAAYVIYLMVWLLNHDQQVDAWMAAPLSQMPCGHFLTIVCVAVYFIWEGRKK